MMAPVYLDFAATSAIRPPEVPEAVSGYLRDHGATPGRSGHARALHAGRVVLRCRRALAELFGIEGDPGRVTLQLNATHALNVALLGLLAPGDRVVRTAYDHNSVRRPVAALAGRGVRESVVAGRPDAGVDLLEVRDLLRGEGKPARLLVLPHVSNVTGATLPVREMADLAHEVGALVLVDAAQSAGHLHVDVDALGADLLAFTGHKGLLGPQGVGGLWVREGVEVAPLVHGGTGSESGSSAMPDALPDRLEGGSQNAPGIAGLLAGVEWLTREGARVSSLERDLKRELHQGLVRLPGVDVRSPAAPGGAPLVTLTARRMDPGQLSTRLEREFGIQGRAGLHCAPGAHEALGTAGAGALRLSIGWCTTRDDIQRAIQALEQITAQEAHKG